MELIVRDEAQRQTTHFIDHRRAAMRLYDVRRLMSAVSIFDAPVSQIENACKNGDEHLRVIAFAKEIVQATQNDRNRFRGCESRDPERSSHHGHKKRRGYTFVRYVADDEANAIIVEKEEVVEIAAYILRRFNGSKDVDLRDLGKSRKFFRNQPHLYLAGQLQRLLEHLALQISRNHFRAFQRDSQVDADSLEKSFVLRREGVLVDLVQDLNHTKQRSILAGDWCG